MNDDTANNASIGWLDKFAGWTKQFIDAVAHARIPPDSMAIVPEQGVINALTTGIGVVLYTASAQVVAARKDFTIASTMFLTAVSASLLFVAAIVVLAIAKGPKEILASWQRLASVFLVVWLLALAIFLLLTYPLMFVAGIILLDEMVYHLNSKIFSEAQAWQDDLAKSLICAFLAGLFILYRTRMLDQNFALRSAKPWIWLATVTIVVGVVMDAALFQPWRNVVN